MGDSLDIPDISLTGLDEIPMTSQHSQAGQSALRSEINSLWNERETLLDDFKKEQFGDEPVGLDMNSLPADAFGLGEVGENTARAADAAMALLSPNGRDDDNDDDDDDDDDDEGSSSKGGGAAGAAASSSHAHDDRASACSSGSAGRSRFSDFLPPNALSGKRRLEFDPNKLMVEELREECRLRKLTPSGPKVKLVERLEAAIEKDGTLPLHRLCREAKKRKRGSNRREPQRSDFKTEEEYFSVWTKWRETRNNNNESVKKSRENAKVRKMEHERLCTEREAENQKLASEVTRLREEVSFLTKVLRNPKALNSQEQHLVELLLSSVEDLSAKKSSS